MSEEQKGAAASEQEGQAGQAEQSARDAGEQKIMCFVSKAMVPINQTVELEYMPGKKVRVLPEYIKYEREESVL